MPDTAMLHGIPVVEHSGSIIAVLQPGGSSGPAGTGALIPAVPGMDAPRAAVPGAATPAAPVIPADALMPALLVTPAAPGAADATTGGSTGVA